MIPKTLLVLGLCAVYVSYISYHIPVPADILEPWKLRLSLTRNALLVNIISALDRCGIVNDYEAQRRIRSDCLTMEGVDIREDTIDGVRVHVFTPIGVSTDRGLVYYHGGGWVLGTSASESNIAGYMAKEGKIKVISVDYRLAPEHSKDNGLEDCVKVTKYVIENSQELGLDAEHIAVAGASAGGNYAAAVSLKLRDDGFSPMPKLQVLLVPVLQAIDTQLPSYQQNQDGPHLTSSRMNWFFSYVFTKDKRVMPYLDSNTHVTSDVRVSMARNLLNHDLLPDHNKYPPYVKPNYKESGSSEIWDQIKEDVMDPYGYPLMAEDLTNLPEAYIFTAQYDILRDEGYLYAHHLKQAGVKITHHNCVFGWHSMLLYTDMKDVRGAFDQIIDALHERL